MTPIYDRFADELDNTTELTAEERTRLARLVLATTVDLGDGWDLLGQWAARTLEAADDRR